MVKKGEVITEPKSGEAQEFHRGEDFFPGDEVDGVTTRHTEYVGGVKAGECTETGF